MRASVIPALTAGILKEAPRTIQMTAGFEPGRNRDIWLYRERTTGLLRRYLRFSIEVGRLPSLLGREFFRTRVTSYRVTSFEDAVIFVHDVERALERLDPFDQDVIARIVFQEYTQEETAGLMRCWRRTIARRFHDALDRLSEIFLEGGLLLPFPNSENEECQEANFNQSLASDSAGGK